MKNRKKKYFITSLLFYIIANISLVSLSCKFFNTVEETVKGKDYNEEIKSVIFSSTTLNINVNESEMLKLTLSPGSNQGKCSVLWEYDSEYIEAKTDNFGAIITGKKAGSTFIKAKCNGIIATCLLSIISNGDDLSENPYIYSNYSVVQLQSGNTTTIRASLYGGSIAEMEDFQWEIKDSSIASISWTRNNCVITAKKAGSTQLVCSHPKAKYDYTFVIYVYNDKLTETYITTDYNVLSVNKDETPSKILTVDLINPIRATYKNGFSWKYADEQSKSVIQMQANLNTAEIVPLKNGVANIVVSHENSEYDLNIIVRVTTIVKNVYIGVSESTLLVEGSETPYTVYANLENYDNYVSPDSFVWSIPEEAASLAECTISGNALRIQGKKNGTFKATVSHEFSEYSRNVLVILQNQIGSAKDASMYITTDQNYVQTQVGKEPTTINVRLIGGVDGEDNVGDDSTNFSWYIKGGKDNGIVEIQQVTGYVKNSSSRAVSAASSGEICSASLVINPIAAGEVVIAVTHPRCLYDTEIRVKVFSETALFNPKTITTDASLIKLLNGSTKEITATLKNQDSGDENKIEWSSENSSVVSVSPSTGQTTVINACGSGSHQTYVTAHLDGALSDKKILVFSADTEEALLEMKGIFADNTYLRISTDETKTIEVEQFGLSTNDRVTWTSSNSSVCIVSGESSSPNCTQARVTGIKKGNATVTATIGSSEAVVFEVTVLDVGESSEIYDENTGYLTTNQNAVVLESIDERAALNVTGVNISTADMQLYTNWTMNDVNAVEGEPVFNIYGNPGSTVQLSANKPGKTNITVKNKMSSNNISINAKCGELYEWTDNYIVYITAENDVVNMMNGESTTIGCSLVNTTQKGSFYWEVTQGSENIEITGLSSGICNIKALQAGQSIISVKNSLAGEITKEILVNIANSEEELKGFKYLTTTQNVVSVGEQNNITVTVEVKNSDTNIISGYSWRSINSNVATVVGSGNVAVIYGKSIGSTKVIVENYENCSYPLEIIVNVVDPIAAASDPYISCNNIVTCRVGGDNAIVVAELIGGFSNDVTGFTWNIVDSSVAALYASNDTAQIKALSEGVTQVVVSHPKASVSRSILVICEPKITTNCYISLTESIIKMSPSDDSKTVTATLVNGNVDDIYDFKWWADSYDKINMNYTGASCLIEPIASGTVTIHCSHPKAANTKDIVLYISNYTDFAFAQSSIELTTGTDTFINMEVPATGVECEISFKSSDNSLCTAFGNSSVCTLHPGVIPRNQDSASCTITATLMTKGGVKQAEAQLLVVVTKKDETKPYIGLYPDTSSTIITMNKDEVRNISAKLYGTTIDTNSAGLNWSIAEDGKKIIEFTTSKTTGADVQIRAVNSGKTVLNITHAEAKNPVTIYVIVTGVDEPTVTLNYSNLPIYIGEDTQILQATVLNDTGEELEWKVVNDSDSCVEQDYFAFSYKGNKASIFAQKPGTATIYCTIPSNNSTASCKVEIREAEKINFFVYDDESAYTLNSNGTIKEDYRTKYYLTTFQLYPGETKPLHYETVPAKDKISSWYRSDNSYFDINTTSAGYLTTWTDSVTGEVYHYPDGVGTIAISGKTNEGTAILQATTSSKQTDSVSITNSYNYLFTIDKTIISTNPKAVHEKPELLYVNYELRPACSKIIITNETIGEVGKNITLKNAEYDSVHNQWIVDTHEATESSSSTGIVKGTLKFEVNGEVNCNINLKAVNENIVSSGGNTVTAQEFGSQNLKIQVYYAKHTFTPSIKCQVPYINRSCYSNTTKNTLYSRYDKSTNTIFLGDGEYLSGEVSVNEPYSNCYIESVSFKKDKSCTIKDKCNDSGTAQVERTTGNSSGGSYNSHDFELMHTHDYAVIRYKKSKSESFFTSISNGMENMYRLLLESDKSIEIRNTTVKETSYVGFLEIKYLNYASSNGSEYQIFKIPVYVQVRNSPCCENNDYYKAYIE